jgi:hypothetical protein
LVLFSREPGKTLKRESGENPEQTRCCKLRPKFTAILATGSDREGAGERSKSEDLPDGNSHKAFVE